MKNTVNDLRRLSGSLMKKLSFIVLILSFILSPLLSVNAQEAQTPVITTEENPSEPVGEVQGEEITSIEVNTPQEEIPETGVGEEPATEAEEILPEEEMMALASSTMPNSSREVLQSVRNRVSSDIDPLTGALIYKFPIVTPPGRNEMTPDVAIVYNSADANMDSVIGSGWSIDIPSIQRVNKTGTQALYSTDNYSSSFSGELVSNGVGTYGAKSDNGDYLKYTKNTNGWTVVDKKGTIYTFGLNAGARQDNPSDSTKIYKWMLEEVRDRNNNYITYEYYKDAGQIYPSRIVYTGNGSTPGIFEINFDREVRTGGPTLMSTGFGVKSNYRISEIRTEINNVWARKYILSYTNADNGSTHLLNNITESGRDESGNINTLPVIDFDYQTSTSNRNFTYDANFILPMAFFGGNDNGMRMSDYNGDTLPDIICHGEYTNGECGQNNTSQSFLNNSTTWNYSGVWGSPAKFVTNQYADTGLRLVDVNGDGLTDMAQAKEGASNSIWINNGAGWTLDTSWTLPLPFIDSSNRDYGMRMADLNGDGLPDIICQSGQTNGLCGTSNATQQYLNTGSGWVTTSNYSAPPFVDNQYKDTGTRIIDINGDGLADLVKYKDGNTQSIYINHGSGWTLDTNWSLPIAIIDSAGRDYGMRMTDLNGDGLTDIICRGGFTNGTCGIGNGTVSYLNNGIGWTATSWGLPAGQDGSGEEKFVTSQYVDRGLRIVDVNSDGIPDIVRGEGSNKFVYKSNNTKPVNFLTKITYPEGGDTTITYKSSAQFKDGSNNLLNPNLPLINTVVSQISDNDGVTSIVHNYTYEGGRYYFNGYLDRKFAGFAVITDTDSAGNVKKTFYHQGNTTDTANGEFLDHVSKIGKVYRVEEYDNNSNLYRLTVNKWENQNISTGREFVKLSRQTVLNYDGDGDHADNAIEYIYGSYGNLQQTINWGAVTANNDGSFTDTGTDKSTETIAYASNVTPYVVGLPQTVTLVNQSSVKTREERMYYDNLALGSVGAGNLTKLERWKTASTYINSQKAYNTTYGIVTSDTDPRGKVTSYIYDSYNLYPVTVTNPLSQTTQYTYDYSLGKPKQVTDQNSFIYQTVYDGFDRVLQEKIPGPTTPFTPITKTTYQYTDTQNDFAVQRTDHLDGSTAVETYQYFDKLGRLIQERKESETSYNVRDIVYNNRGLVLKESLPYINSGTLKTSATGTSNLYTNYTYDPLNRPLTVINALGTTTYAYDDWKTTVTDAESNVKHYIKNARGNLIQVQEILGASTYNTYYVWNLNGNLTRITDALNNVRNFTYDGLGRRLTAQDLHASADVTYGTWTHTYDDAGNLTRLVTPKAATIDYTYNDINQILTENHTGVAGTEITYTYSVCTNGTGKLCTVTMTSGANSAYTYNSTGDVSSEVKTINSTGYTTSFTYDRQKNILTIVHPDSAETKYTFNAAGLMETIQRKESGGAFTDVVSNFNYSPVNRPTTITFPNTVTTTNTYDATKMYRLTRRLTQNTVPTKLQDLNYTYDNVNNITQIIDASNTSGSKTANYVYDDLNRMTSATITAVAGGQTTYTHNYVYNALGNITSGPIGAYTYAGTNYSNPHAATSINGVTYTYDNNGNLTGNGTLANTWNYKDQLTQAIVGGITSTYLYDEAGNRV